MILTVMIFKSDIDKAHIAKMPIVRFEGRIIVIQTAKEAARAVSYLETFPIIGIDTETRPSFFKGKMNSVALLQASTEDTCFLFRLNSIGLTPEIIRLLQGERPVKVGLSLKDDFCRLHDRGRFKQRGYIELQEYVAKLGFEAMSLQKICALVLGRRLSKAQRLSNWEADVLTDSQKNYAATDAWICVEIYNRLEKLRNAGELIVEPTVKNEKNERMKK